MLVLLHFVVLSLFFDYTAPAMEGVCNATAIDSQDEKKA
jgi:hypothetical protein